MKLLRKVFFLSLIIIQVNCELKDPEEKTNEQKDSKTELIEDKETENIEIQFQEKKNITNSIWTNKISEECIDSLIFQDSSVVQYYSCETNLHYPSKYFYLEDTLVINKSDFYPEMDGNKRILYDQVYWKLLKRNERLEFVKIEILDELDGKLYEPTSINYKSLGYFKK